MRILSIDLPWGTGKGHVGLAWYDTASPERVRVTAYATSGDNPFAHRFQIQNFT